MDRFLKNQAVLAECKIYQMLESHAKEKHVSFHTPGHKMGAWDITELSFSDNLSCPRGCIAEAEKDIAKILGAEKSFILTDGSTSGVLSMLQAAKTLGVKTVAVCESSHKSLFNGCALLGLTPLVYPCEYREKIPFAHTMYALNEKYGEIFAQADALFFTSPDYYGNVADLAAIREYCDATGKLLIVDGAHGGHLHYDKKLHAGAYADMWVDGVHKSLPAFTQGAIVSARAEKTAMALENAVDIFRTTSPSYPIMASVEYAVKYPRNLTLEKAVKGFQQHDRVYQNDDWTKLCVFFGGWAFDAEKRLESEGIYAEFCDGETLTFYLSPATSEEEFTLLKTRLLQLFEEYPLSVGKSVQQIPAPLISTDRQVEWVALNKAENRVCAGICGLFPPCVPLFQIGEVITKEKIEKLQKANNVFGLKDGKILTFQEEK
ncbi:MAG: aminotransferase class I/II-fold pyridoxal phosphate-dependent enzyme [Clostridia bacterium]|nr:aminotransferase class I/II-fold pyridoxal phosphate-dependent enzyme [Clostridia bacterium]